MNRISSASSPSFPILSKPNIDSSEVVWKKRFWKPDELVVRISATALFLLGLTIGIASLNFYASSNPRWERLIIIAITCLTSGIFLQMNTRKSQLIIREATYDDAESIAKVHVNSWQLIINLFPIC